MPKEPACGLCSGSLVREKDVPVTATFATPLAWVCTQCSAMFPIAVKIEGGMFSKSARPLYADGKRQD